MAVLAVYIERNLGSIDVYDNNYFACCKVQNKSFHRHLRFVFVNTCRRRETREILDIRNSFSSLADMGKNKKVRNWKARQVVSGVLDDRETKELEARVVIEDAQV